MKCKRMYAVLGEMVAVSESFLVLLCFISTVESLRRADCFGIICCGCEYFDGFLLNLLKSHYIKTWKGTYETGGVNSTPGGDSQLVSEKNWLKSDFSCVFIRVLCA